MSLRVMLRFCQKPVAAVDHTQVPTLRQQLGKPRFSFHLQLRHCLLNKSCLQRHVTRQKILNWKQTLRFPSKPRVSHEGVNLMQQLLCEPEDRLGSQTSSSVNRPDALVVQARRSSFIPHYGTSGSVDGSEFIKVCIYHGELLRYSEFKSII